MGAGIYAYARSKINVVFIQNVHSFVSETNQSSGFVQTVFLLSRIAEVRILVFLELLRTCPKQNEQTKLKVWSEQNDVC